MDNVVGRPIKSSAARSSTIKSPANHLPHPDQHDLQRVWLPYRGSQIAAVLVGTCILEHVFRVRADLCPVDLNIFLGLKGSPTTVSEVGFTIVLSVHPLSGTYATHHEVSEVFHRVVSHPFIRTHSGGTASVAVIIISPFVFVVILGKFKKSSYFPKSPVNNPSGPFYRHLAHPGCQSKSSTVSSASSPALTYAVFLASSASFCAGFSFPWLLFPWNPVLSLSLPAGTRLHLPPEPVADQIASMSDSACSALISAPLQPAGRL